MTTKKKIEILQTLLCRIVEYQGSEFMCVNLFQITNRDNVKQEIRNELWVDRVKTKLAPTATLFSAWYHEDDARETRITNITRTIKRLSKNNPSKG